MATNELGSDKSIRGNLVEETIPVPGDCPSDSSSPQALRHGNADPYHYEGDVSFSGFETAPERAGKFEFQGQGGDQLYDVKK
jgi:hypothetical protein